MTRLIGHALLREGAVYDDNGNLPHGQVNRNGPGRAKCERGALSWVLPSGSARKRWHAGHKEDVAK